MLCAKLRTSGVDVSEGAKEEIERIVNYIRNQWPEVKIVVWGDSGSAWEEIMSWCEGTMWTISLGLQETLDYNNRYKAKWKRQENNMSRQGV